MNKAKMEEYQADNPEGSNVEYLYPLPQLAEYSIAPVELYKNGSFVDICLSIDDAFSAMTDRNGEYEIRLIDYNLVGSALLLSSSAMDYHITATQTPAVKSITLRGIYYDLGNDYSTVLGLEIENTLTLQSDLRIYDLRIWGESSIDLKSKKLSCLGQYVQVTVPITGSMDSAAPSELYINTLKAGVDSTFNSVRVHTLSAEEKSVFFRDDTEIVKATAATIRFDGRGTAYIHEFFPSQFPSVGSINVSDGVKMRVDRITSSDQFMYLQYQFGKLEDFSTITIGSSNTEVRLCLDGQITTVVTDAAGNEVGRYTESVNPEDLTTPIAILLDKSLMDNLTVYFVKWEDDSGIWIDHTDEYMLNSQNQIVRK